MRKVVIANVILNHGRLRHAIGGTHRRIAIVMITDVQEAGQAYTSSFFLYALIPHQTSDSYSASLKTVLNEDQQNWSEEG